MTNFYNCFRSLRSGAPTVIQSWLELDEGYLSFPGESDLGYWIIGIGHMLEDKPIPVDVLRLLSTKTPVVPSEMDGHYPRSVTWFRQIGGITHAEAMILLQYDLDEIRSWLPDLVPNVEDLSPARSGALYNLGFHIHNLKYHMGKFWHAETTKIQRFFELVDVPDWNKAAAELRTTSLYRNFPARYERIAIALETGELPEEIE